MIIYHSMGRGPRGYEAFNLEARRCSRSFIVEQVPHIAKGLGGKPRQTETEDKSSRLRALAGSVHAEFPRAEHRPAWSSLPQHPNRGFLWHTGESSDGSYSSPDRGDLRSIAQSLPLSSTGRKVGTRNLSFPLRFPRATNLRP